LLSFAISSAVFCTVLLRDEGLPPQANVCADLEVVFALHLHYGGKQAVSILPDADEGAAGHTGVSSVPIAGNTGI
jgi:hypothetical protein